MTKPRPLQYVVPFSVRSNLPDCPFNEDVDVTVHCILLYFHSRIPIILFTATYA
jgi:hypothetical protein